MTLHFLFLFTAHSMYLHVFKHIELREQKSILLDFKFRLSEAITHLG
jgi:hypothetical protein